MLGHFERLQPGFGGVKFRRLPRRFKRTVYALDSTTIKLVRQLHGLGQAPATQGGREASPAT